MKEKQPYEKPKMTFVENQPERRKSLKKEKIVLPIDEFDKPDYAFMEQYVKQQIATLKLQYLQEKMSVTN